MTKTMRTSEEGGQTGPRLTLPETAKKLTKYMKQLPSRFCTSVSSGRGPAGVNSGGEPRTAPRERRRAAPGESPASRTLRPRDRHRDPGASSVQTMKPEKRAAKGGQKIRESKQENQGIQKLGFGKDQ